MEEGASMSILRRKTKEQSSVESSSDENPRPSFRKIPFLPPISNAIFSALVLLPVDLILDPPFFVGCICYTALLLIPYASYFFIFAWIYPFVLLISRPITGWSIVFFVLFAVYIIYDLLILLCFLQYRRISRFHDSTK